MADWFAFFSGFFAGMLFFILVVVGIVYYRASKYVDIDKVIRLARSTSAMQEMLQAPQSPNASTQNGIREFLSANRQGPSAEQQQQHIAQLIGTFSRMFQGFDQQPPNADVDDTDAEIRAAKADVEKKDN
jgi:hypothetical protein